MTFVRWAMRDLETDEELHFLINPNEMETPYAPHDTTFFARSANKSNRVLRKGFTPFEWTFSGVVLEREHYKTLRQSTHRRAKLRLIDHFQRAMIVRVIGFHPEQKAPKRLAHPWRHTYTMRCLVYSEPTPFNDPVAL